MCLNENPIPRRHGDSNKVREHIMHRRLLSSFRGLGHSADHQDLLSTTQTPLCDLDHGATRALEGWQGEQ
ncbi:hypothetical protein CORC01_01422 [Colletotrichum orchidophilum]|uniref:Uncharacterized protein n=1 Tax=Colletotrichum orchidophilum TaxID=1209926 RepID=A0A1G4BPI6_9PEZI|nr:uncharacterized protein CORC01_01422 [Colletotrichum orchidophilum]OHF03369.1 hypothetical protein CORC01_01422 [Colletotrichum orchidophilum]